MAIVDNTFCENVPYGQDAQTFVVDENKNWPAGYKANTGVSLVDMVGYQTRFVYNQLLGSIGGHYAIKSRTKLVKIEEDQVGDLSAYGDDNVPGLLPGAIIGDMTIVGEYEFKQTVLEDNLALAELQQPGFSTLKQP